MTEATYKAIVVSACDYKENDKLLKLLTPDGGIISAVMRGVKKPTAKMRFGAVPFAFCEYTLNCRYGLAIVTGCSQIEDLFRISEEYDKYTASCIMLEVAVSLSSHEPSPKIFILLLKSLRQILYSQSHPFLVATSFVQRAIHDFGYDYKYMQPPREIATVMDLLSLLNGLDIELMESRQSEGAGSDGERNGADDSEKRNGTGASKECIRVGNQEYEVETDLIKKTLKKLIQSFENKFDEINSKKLLP